MWSPPTAWCSAPPFPSVTSHVRHVYTLFPLLVGGWCCNLFIISFVFLWCCTTWHMQWTVELSRVSDVQWLKLFKTESKWTYQYFVEPQCAPFGPVLGSLFRWGLGRDSTGSNPAVSTTPRGTPSDTTSQKRKKKKEKSNSFLPATAVNFSATWTGRGIFQCS